MSELKQIIEGRRLAGELLSILDGDTFSGDKCRGFWAEMLDRCPEHFKPSTPPTEKLLTMTDDQAARFESQTIWFGAHSGTMYRDVPIDYLTWLSDQTLPLQAYLRSWRGQQRIERGELS